MSRYWENYTPTRFHTYILSQTYSSSYSQSNILKLTRTFAFILTHSGAQTRNRTWRHTPFDSLARTRVFF